MESSYYATITNNEVEGGTEYCVGLFRHNEDGIKRVARVSNIFDPADARHVVKCWEDPVSRAVMITLLNAKIISY